METDNAPEVTPADRRRLRVRESIISAAERVFAREGETGLSIRRFGNYTFGAISVLVIKHAKEGKEPS